MGTAITATGITFPDATTQTTAATGGGGIGVGQTWQDVTASRAVGTTYTNSTGKPIMVNIYGTNTGASQVFTLTVGGVAVAKQQGDTTNGAAASSICAIIPDGTTYVLTGTRSLSLWAELR